jgi:hypothetical protein
MAPAGVQAVRLWIPQTGVGLPCSTAFSVGCPVAQSRKPQTGFCCLREASVTIHLPVAELLPTTNHPTGLTGARQGS